MADYTWAVGSSGTMMIRDTGTYVEFWLKAGSSTFNSSLPWGYTVNGVTDNTNSFNFVSGGNWQRLGRWLVTTDQTVTFRLFDTGTSGLGSGETHSVAIDRTSAPPKPPPWVIEQIQNTRVQGDVDGAGNGGLAIDSYQTRYDESSTAASPLYSTDDNLDGWQWIEGLTPGTLYYFWVRTHNAKGWSPWSDRTQARTHNVPDIPGSPVITDIKQSSVWAKFTANGNGGSAILEYQIAYATNLTFTENPGTVTGNNLAIAGLVPGATHYFRARVRNVYGWSNWSGITSARLFAGAWVDVAGVKRRAVPYVNVGGVDGVGGVWHVAEGRAKIAGLWKPTA